jgi:DNA-binding transcriptional LysR family regulator
MARPAPKTSRIREMEVFVGVVELAGLSAAAGFFRLMLPAVSTLEARLGVRLLNRWTHKLQLTPEGAAFYEHSLRVLADIDEAERAAAAGAMPRSRVRINANIPFGLHHLLPLVPGFTGLDA